MREKMLYFSLSVLPNLGWLFLASDIYLRNPELKGKTTLLKILQWTHGI